MKTRKIIFTIFAIAICFNSIYAQEHKMSCCSSGMKKADSAMNESKCDSTDKMDMQHDQHKHSEIKAEKPKEEKLESIVHKGTIDLKSIDKNKDGKVFQCPMDYNVISDKAGKCPICKMSLKEVPHKVAKENLIKNGFKVK